CTVVVRVADDDVDAAGLASRRREVGPRGAEHDDAVPEAELCVLDASVVARVHRVSLGSERGRQELDRRRRVVVANGRKYGWVAHCSVLSSKGGQRKPAAGSVSWTELTLRRDRARWELGRRKFAGARPGDLAELP